MRLFFFGFAIAVLAEVEVLTQDNFDSFIASNARVLVEFYAPWCGHCKQLEPAYNKASEMLIEAKLQSKLAKVDATVESALASRFGVEGYPTLYYFVNGEKSDYAGPRDADGIVGWLKAREVSPLDMIEEGDVEKITKEGYLVLVGHVLKKSKRFKVLESVAGKFIETKYLKVNAVALPKGASKSDSKLVLYRSEFQEPDATEVAFTGQWTVNNILAWISKNEFPTVGAKFNKEQFSKLAESKAKAGVYMIVDDQGALDDELAPEIRPILVDLAKKKTDYRFTFVDYADLERDNDYGMFSLVKEAERVPYLYIITTQHKRYRLTDNFSRASIEKFLADFEAKKLKPFLKSAAVPEKPQEDGVTVVVGQTFDEIVMDPTKDVFVEFYAPWCGHCKNLAPKWIELAQAASRNGWKDVVIAKMDSTENECDEEVQGYPTLVFYPAVKAARKFRERIKYSGAHEVEALLEFVSENALTSAELKSAKRPKTSMVDRELEKRRKAKAKAEKAEL